MSWGVSAPRFDNALVALAGAQRKRDIRIRARDARQHGRPLSGQRWLRRLTRTPERRMSVLASWRWTTASTSNGHRGRSRKERVRNFEPGSYGDRARLSPVAVVSVGRWSAI